MGRPRGRKRPIKESPPLVPEPEESAPTAAGEVASERGGIVEQQQLFADREESHATAVDQTVQRRIAAIQAICDAEIENLLCRLRLLRSCHSKEQRKTPALEFFGENLPNFSIVKNESEEFFELEWKDKAANFHVNHVTERNVLASLDRSSLAASSSALEFSAQSFKMSFLEAACLQIPGSGLEEPSELQFVGSKDVFQTPGASNHRLSVGMTPKSLRLPKHGEMLLSIRGSPLGVYREENLEAIHESGECSHAASQ